MATSISTVAYIELHVACVQQSRVTSFLCSSAETPRQTGVLCQKALQMNSRVCKFILEDQFDTEAERFSVP